MSTGFPKPSVDELIDCIDFIWLTVASSARAQEPQGIKSFYELLTGKTLEPIYGGLGFKKLEDFLDSEFCTDVIYHLYEKDEWDKAAKKKYQAVSFADCRHITNMMTESEIAEQNRESLRKQNRVAKFSTEEYQLKSIEFRETLVRIVHILEQERGVTDVPEVSWQSIQTAWEERFAEKLNRNRLREAFPSGSPQEIMQRHMRDEFEFRQGESGMFWLKLKKPVDDIIKGYNEIKAIKSQITEDVVKAPMLRTDRCQFIDFDKDRKNKSQKQESVVETVNSSPPKPVVDPDPIPPAKPSPKLNRSKSAVRFTISTENKAPTSAPTAPAAKTSILKNSNPRNPPPAIQLEQKKPESKKQSKAPESQGPPWRRSNRPTRRGPAPPALNPVDKEIAEKAKEAWTFGSLRKDISVSMESVLGKPPNVVGLEPVKPVIETRVSAKDTPFMKLLQKRSFLDG